MAQMTIPQAMRAVEIAKPGGPEVLRAVQRPVPSPGPSEILIKVAAAGVNRPDVLQRMGNYPVPKDASDLPGLEVSGTIEVEPGTTITWLNEDNIDHTVTSGTPNEPTGVFDAELGNNTAAE